MVIRYCLNCFNLGKLQQKVKLEISINNPLLSEWKKGITLPPYKDIEDLHFEGAINTAMSIQNLKNTHKNSS